MGEIANLQDGIARYKACDIPELRLGVIESIANALMPHLVRRLSASVGSPFNHQRHLLIRSGPNCAPAIWT